MKRQLPSQHEATRLTQESGERAAAEARQREAGRVRQAFDWLLKQENGRIVWAKIFDLCGYNKSSLSYFAGGDVAPLKTDCKEAQRLIYMELRKMVSPDLLAKAEFEAEFGTPEPAKGEKKNG